MLSEKRLLQIAVIVALLGTASLYLYSANQSVNEVKISEIEEKDLGAQVKMQGVITKIDKVADLYMIELKEKGTDQSIQAMVDQETMESVDSKEHLVPGATLQVSGKVQSYQGELNLQVSKTEGVILQEKAYSSFTPISSLLQNPNWFKGMDVKVNGEVKDLRKVGNEISVVNDTSLDIAPIDGYTNRLNVYVEGWDYRDNYGVTLDDNIVVKGEFVYDSFRGRWKIVTSEKPEVH